MDDWLEARKTTHGGDQRGEFTNRVWFGPSSSKIFADILDNLNSAGFALSKIEKRFWTMQYWTPGTKERNLLSDGIWWFVRPQNQKEMIPDWVAEGMISWSLSATSGQ